MSHRLRCFSRGSSLGRWGAAACAVLGCLACGSDPGSPEQPPRPWRRLEFGAESGAAPNEFGGGLLLSVWGRSADDVWLVGGREGQAAILHGNHRGLTSVDNPGEHRAWWVCGLDEGVAVVGERGLVMLQSTHDNGTFEALDLGIDSTFFGCWGKSRDDFWVVGGDPILGPPELAHVRAGKARAPSLGALVTQLPPALFKVSAVEERLFVVGEAGSVLEHDLTRSDDEGWELATLEPQGALFTVSGWGVDDVWTVGGRSEGFAFRYRDGTWEAHPPPQSSGLSGVWAKPNGGVLACGNQGEVFEWDGGAWRRQPQVTTDTLHAVWSAPSGESWAVGGNLFDSDEARFYGVVAIR